MNPVNGVDIKSILTAFGLGLGKKAFMVNAWDGKNVIQIFIAEFAFTV